jgi:hypothetical protein
MFGFTGCRLCATGKFKDNSRAQNSVEQTGKNRSAPTQGTLRALEGENQIRKLQFRV